MVQVTSTVVPTPVGVNRRVVPQPIVQGCCPHTRGGEPQCRAHFHESFARCPHTRGGEPPLQWAEKWRSRVVPTPVGVNRILTAKTHATSCVVPTPVGVNRLSHAPLRHLLNVVPTPVGVNRHLNYRVGKDATLSPHPWG